LSHLFESLSLHDALPISWRLAVRYLNTSSSLIAIDTLERKIPEYPDLVFQSPCFKTCSVTNNISFCVDPVFAEVEIADSVCRGRSEEHTSELQSREISYA